jgi:hypothetical protein
MLIVALIKTATHFRVSRVEANERVDAEFIGSLGAASAATGQRAGCLRGYALKHGALDFSRQAVGRGVIKILGMITRALLGHVSTPLLPGIQDRTRKLGFLEKYEKYFTTLKQNI